MNKLFLKSVATAATLICTLGLSIADAAEIGIVSASKLNIRSGPSTSYSIVGSLYKGNSVNIIGESDNWYKIENKSTDYAWASKTYIDKKISQESSKQYKKASAGLNVRSGQSTSYNKIDYISKGEIVEILSTSSNGWSKVKLSNGTIGYSSNHYLKDIPNTSRVGKITSGVNVRTGQSTSYSKIGYLSKGDFVEVLSTLSSGWSKVRLSDGQIGYSSSKYIDIDDNQNTSDSKEETITVDGKKYEVSKEMRVSSSAYSMGSVTATGTRPTAGRTIAVDPRVIPYGTKVYIPHFDKIFIAEDTGSAIKGNKIDIYMKTVSECLNWGIRNIDVKILK